MKAVILAAGEGNRLRPITSTRPKPLIPIAGKPLLEHTIIGLKEAGIEEILLIVGYKEDLIKDYFDNGIDKYNIKIEYLTQEEYLGTAHAAGYAKEFVGDEKFLLMYGDLLVDPNLFKEVLNKFEASKAEGLISLLEVNNPREFGIISLNPEGFVERITEKPPPELNRGNLANAGIYVFDSMIFKAIDKTKKSIRNEFEFTDSMKILIKQLNGKIVGYLIKDDFWPCYIGENNIIGPNAFIRPYTSIENDCHIGMCEVKNSLIFSNTFVPHFNYIGDSILCENIKLGAGTKISNLRFDNKTIKMKIKEKLVDSGRRKLGAIIGPNSQTGINASIMCGKKIGENSIIGANTLVNEDVPSNVLYYQDSNGNIKRVNNPF